jgi:hypothetical protein
MRVFLDLEPENEPALPDAAVAGNDDRYGFSRLQELALPGGQLDAEQPVHVGTGAEVVEADKAAVGDFEHEVETAGPLGAAFGPEAHRLARE